MRGREISAVRFKGKGLRIFRTALIGHPAVKRVVNLRSRGCRDRKGQIVAEEHSFGREGKSAFTVKNQTYFLNVVCLAHIRRMSLVRRDINCGRTCGRLGCLGRICRLCRLCGRVCRCVCRRARGIRGLIGRRLCRLILTYRLRNIRARILNGILLLSASDCRRCEHRGHDQQGCGFSDRFPHCFHVAFSSSYISITISFSGIKISSLIRSPSIAVPFTVTFLTPCSLPLGLFTVTFRTLPLKFFFMV